MQLKINEQFKKDIWMVFDDCLHPFSFLEQAKNDREYTLMLGIIVYDFCTLFKNLDFEEVFQEIMKKQPKTQEEMDELFDSYHNKNQDKN